MIKNDPKAFVTNGVLTETLDDAVDTLLQGMDNMLEEQKKIFVTKEDLRGVRDEMKLLATKEDLKREVSWLKDDIRGLTADLSGVPSKKEFNKLKEKVDKYLSS